MQDVLVLAKLFSFHLHSLPSFSEISSLAEHFFFFFCLKQQKFIVSQFWKSEVQNQGANRAGSFGILSGRICSILLAVSGVPG